MKFGQNLKNIRKSKKISQEDLADKLGVSRQSVSKWETGENYPSMQNIVCLCDIFKCKMNDLVHEDFEDLDFLGEEVKMNIVKLNQKEQKEMKGISKALYLFGRIGSIFMKVIMVFIIIIMVVVPTIFSKLEIIDNNLVYNKSALEVKEVEKGIEIVLKDHDNIKIADFNNTDIEKIKDVIKDKNKYVTIGLFELAGITYLLMIYLLSILLKYLDKLFTNIFNGDTPFTLDNVSYIKKMSYIMMSSIILPVIGQIFYNLAIMHNIELKIEFFNIFEIVFLYAMSLIFEYGYRIQKDSKGKMYGKFDEDEN